MPAGARRVLIWLAAALATGAITTWIAGDFRVRVPLIGGTAERRIVPGIMRRLDVEAEALRARVG